MPSSTPRGALPGRVLLMLLPLLAPGAAWACMPDFHDQPWPVRILGEDGSVTWTHDQWELTSLSGPENLGGGFVLQFTHEGDFCYGERSMIVQDCATGEAVSVGGAYEAMIPAMHAEEEALFALIRSRAAAGRPLSVAEITREAEAGGVESVVPMRTDSRFSLRGFDFRLGSACRRFYRGLAGRP